MGRSQRPRGRQLCGTCFAARNPRSARRSLCSSGAGGVARRSRLTKRTISRTRCATRRPPCPSTGCARWGRSVAPAGCGHYDRLPTPLGPTPRAGRLQPVILGRPASSARGGVGTLIAVVIGTVLGLLTGYRGGLVDGSRAACLTRARPAATADRAGDSGVIRSVETEPGSIQAALVDRAVLLVIALVYAPIVARRAEQHARNPAAGIRPGCADSWRASGLHRLPRDFALVVPVLVVEAALRFSRMASSWWHRSGFGVAARPPSPDWGLMVNENRAAYAWRRGRSNIPPPRSRCW